MVQQSYLAQPFRHFPASGLETKTHAYLAGDKRSLDMSAMMDTLEREGKAGDAIVLHACCHNPTGIDPTEDQWQELAELTAQRGMLRSSTLLTKDSATDQRKTR